MIQLVLTGFCNEHETFCVYLCSHVSSDTCCKKAMSARIAVIKLNFDLKRKLIFPLTRDLEIPSQSIEAQATFVTRKKLLLSL